MFFQNIHHVNVMNDDDVPEDIENVVDEDGLDVENEDSKNEDAETRASKTTSNKTATKPPVLRGRKKKQNMSKQLEPLEEGTYILAKFQSHPPWPGLYVGKSKTNRCIVSLFNGKGEQTTRHELPRKSITLYDREYAFKDIKIGKFKNLKISFMRAIEELETRMTEDQEQ